MNTEELRKEISRLNTLYRAGMPEVSDSEYDALVERLRRMSPQDPWFSSAEPAPVGQGRKRKLPIPMKSLNKVKSLTELRQWVKSLAIPDTAILVVTPKFDGVSWLHDEETGETYSRGGAENEGQSCAAHYLKGDFGQKRHWPQCYPPRFTFGELVFSRSEWESSFAGKVSTTTGEPYKSPRNTIAGFINREEATDMLRHASFFRYGVGETDLDSFGSYTELYDNLCTVYRQPPLLLTVKASELSEEVLNRCFAEWRTQYFIDGLVIYIDHLNIWKLIGRRQTTGNPLYAIAYKHPDFTDSFEATVQNVDWRVSKAGALKPVVNIDAVDNGDCVIQRPTGYNAKYIFENSIGPRALITLTRSGGVIPKITGVLKEASSQAMCELRDALLYCPACGKPTKWNESAVDLVCTDENCKGRRLAKIVHFYNILEAEQMGDETILKLFNAGYDTLRRMLDITFDEIVRIDGFGEGVANAVLCANSKIRDGVELTKLMHASDCFAGIGQIKAKSILNSLTESDRFAFANGMVSTVEGFEADPRILALGKTAQAFLRGIAPFFDFVAENKLTILPMEHTAKPVGDKYAGMKVCFTGIRDKELEDEIRSQGGEVVSGVSKTTTHLIVADPLTGSGKATKARALKIPVLTVAQFRDL